MDVVELRNWIAVNIMGWVWSDEFDMWVMDSERDADGRLTGCCPDILIGAPTQDDDDDAFVQIPWEPENLRNGQIWAIVDALPPSWCPIFSQLEDKSWEVSINDYSKVGRCSQVGDEVLSIAESINPGLALIEAVRKI